MTPRTWPAKAALFLGLSSAALLTGSQSDASPAAVIPPAAWTETFDRLDADRWVVSSWDGFWQQDGLKGGFDPGNAYVDGQGHLVLALDVQPCAAGLCAQAAELQSRTRLGFGRYSVRMRAASSSARADQAGKAQPGNISGAFSYFDRSATEIDVEIEGSRSVYLNATVWRGPDAKSTALLPSPARDCLAREFHTYTYDWRPDRMTYFIDGVKVWETTRNVPQQAAYLMLNVWPTMNANWGGQAKAGTVYMLVDSISYQPG